MKEVHFRLQGDPVFTSKYMKKQWAYREEKTNKHKFTAKKG